MNRVLLVAACNAVAVGNPSCPSSQLSPLSFVSPNVCSSPSTPSSVGPGMLEGSQCELGSGANSGASSLALLIPRHQPIALQTRWRHSTLVTNHEGCVEHILIGIHTISLETHTISLFTIGMSLQGAGHDNGVQWSEQLGAEQDSLCGGGQR